MYKLILVEETTEDDRQSSEFITTFETTTENGKTVIKTKNKKITQKDNFVVEEVLSEEETATSKDEQHDVQIVEVVDEDIPEGNVIIIARVRVLTCACFNFNLDIIY